MYVAHPKMKERRDRMRELGICINASLIIATKADGSLRAPPLLISGKPRVEHGPVVKGGKCQRCLDVHKGIDPKEARS